MADIVLHVVYADRRLFAALANGSLAVLEGCVSDTPDSLEMYYIPLGPAPITCVVTVTEQEQVWLTTANMAIVLNMKLG